MSQICSQLSSLGHHADPATVSSLLRDDPASPAPASPASPAGAAKETAEEKATAWSEEKCKEKVCDSEKQKEDFCAEENEKKECWKHCCEGSSCFPGEALVNVEGSKLPVPVSDIHVGDRILVERAGQLVHEPVLAFLHARREGLAP